MADKYNTAERQQMAKQGQAMSDGSYPIKDSDDLDNAIHAVGRGGASHDAIRRHIIGRAKALGLSSSIPASWGDDGSLGGDSDADGDSDGGRSAQVLDYTRAYQLEDISIRSGGDGRTVDAYAAVFDTPTEIHDQDGDYFEVLDPSCFNRAIEFGRRAKGGWSIPVMFNHGMTIFHTPSAQDSMPIGVPEEIKADGRGLFTRTRYHNTPRADEALEAIREGSITAYSFAGKFHRSSPIVPRGKFRADRTGQLPTVRRMASTLREYGPTPFPACAGAEVLGVRAEQAAFLLGSLSADERHRLAALLTQGTPGQGPAFDQDPPSGHSGRSPKQQIQAARAAFLLKTHGGH